MASNSLSPAELGRIAGPLFVGYILDWGMFGVLSMQVYIYYLAFPKDRVESKTLVYGLYLLETTQTMLFTSSAFRTFATGFRDQASLDQVDTLWFSVPIMSGIIALIAQISYAYRITVFTKSKYIAGVIILLACVQLGGAIAIGVETKKSILFSRFLKPRSFTTASAAIWEGGSAACNVMIAICMTYYLRRQHQDSSLKQTHVHLTRMIRLTIETGTLTAVIAIVTLVLTFLPGRPIYYQASVSFLGKIYSNSIMVAFNSRMKIGSSNTSATAHEVAIPLSQSGRTRGEIVTGSETQVRVTREEVTFPESGVGMTEKVFKRSSQDLKPLRAIG